MKNILIIGAGKGIGLATAKILQSENLFTISRNLTADLSALNTTFFEADVATDDLVHINLPEELHGLVFCPGSINLKPFNRLSESDFLADFNQNFLGAVKIIQRSLPALKSRVVPAWCCFLPWQQKWECLFTPLLRQVKVLLKVLLKV
jgi:NAD(P)-dependent dehydrogenase (short-subunit alcohol dehydrogenase family)